MHICPCFTLVIRLEPWYNWRLPVLSPKISVKPSQFYSEFCFFPSCSWVVFSSYFPAVCACVGCICLSLIEIRTYIILCVLLDGSYVGTVVQWLARLLSWTVNVSVNVSLTLWWTGDIYRLHLNSHLMTAGIGPSAPQDRYRKNGWVIEHLPSPFGEHVPCSSSSLVSLTFM